MPHPRKAPAAYTSHQAAKRLKVSVKTLERIHRRAERAKDPSLAPFRYQPYPGAKEWRYPMAEFERWILENVERERRRLAELHSATAAEEAHA